MRDINWFFFKLDSTFKQIFIDWKVKALKKKKKKKKKKKEDELSLFLILMNHSMTDDLSFHWFSDVLDWTMLLILSRITLLILSILDFEGLIKRQEILFGKASLWSLIVMYASGTVSVYNVFQEQLKSDIE